MKEEIGKVREEFQQKWSDVVKQISKVENKVEAHKKEYAEAKKRGYRSQR